MNRKLSSNFSPPSHPLPSVAILPRNIAPLTKWVLYVRLSIYAHIRYRFCCCCCLFVVIESVPSNLHAPAHIARNWISFNAIFWRDKADTQIALLFVYERSFINCNSHNSLAITQTKGTTKNPRKSERYGVGKIRKAERYYNKSRGKRAYICEEKPKYVLYLEDNLRDMFICG